MIKVLVIRGEGRAFSAGGDLQTFDAAAEANMVVPVVGELLYHYHGFIEIARRMPKIVLSSVHGSAAGFGMGLTFIADLYIAAKDAKFTPGNCFCEIRNEPGMRGFIPRGDDVHHHYSLSCAAGWPVSRLAGVGETGARAWLVRFHLKRNCRFNDTPTSRVQRRSFKREKSNDCISNQISSEVGCSG